MSELIRNTSLSWDSFNQQVQRARTLALQEAREKGNFVHPCGVFLITYDARGNSCMPSALGKKACVFVGQQFQIERLLDRIIKSYDHVTRLAIVGCYATAESSEGFATGAAYPWMSRWEVTIWERK